MITPVILPPGFAPTTSIGFISNEGKQRYLLEAQSTSDFVAWKLADGTILISNAMQVSLPPSAFVVFWSCAGYQDTTPAGLITAFDCHGNSLTSLDVRNLSGLEYLDCCYNRLESLPLDGLSELQVVDVNHNRLAALEVRHLSKLRIIDCSYNRLVDLDVSSLPSLQVLDCINNPKTKSHPGSCRL